MPEPCRFSDTGTDACQAGQTLPLIRARGAIGTRLALVFLSRVLSKVTRMAARAAVSTRTWLRGLTRRLSGRPRLGAYDKTLSKETNHE